MYICILCKDVYRTPQSAYVLLFSKRFSSVFSNHFTLTVEYGKSSSNIVCYSCKDHFCSLFQWTPSKRNLHEIPIVGAKV